MTVIPAIPVQNWPEKVAEFIVSAISLIAFAFLDLMDLSLCIFYRYADHLLEETSIPCYCSSKKDRLKQEFGVGGDGEGEISETLYQRENLFRFAASRIEQFLGFLRIKQLWGSYRLRRNKEHCEKKGALMAARWSDCNCGSCVSWQGKGGKLHLDVLEPMPGVDEHCIENVIFLHGFISSSSIWGETVFPNLSDSAKQNYRLFAMDLLGFGRSPKPRDCLYTLKEHLEMIENSIIKPFQLNSFHLVAHSMGCIIALALAAKYPNSVKSITLAAPPYFPASPKEQASHIVLNKLAQRRVWPPLLFGSSVMSWYEHVGRSVCFIVCRNHQIWENIPKLLSWKRDTHFMTRDLTRHTHHSAWHTMHNVVCGGAKLMDEYFEIVNKLGVLVTMIHGSKDQVVPLECSFNVKQKVPLAEVKTITNADHYTIILGRERDFAKELEQIWASLPRVTS